MPTITLEVPQDMAEQLEQVRERLPEVLALGLNRLSPVPAEVYRYIFDFLARGPTPAEIVALRPKPEMQARLQTLLERNAEGQLTLAESRELDEYERIEHFIVMLKSGHLPQVTGVV